MTAFVCSSIVNTAKENPVLFEMMRLMDSMLTLSVSLFHALPDFYHITRKE